MGIHRLVLCAIVQAAMLFLCALPALGQIYATSNVDPGQAVYYEQPVYDEVAVPYEPLDGCYLTRPPARFGTANFDVMVLNRSDAELSDLVREFGSATAVLDTSGLPLGAAAAFRFKWTFESDCGTDLQLAYLGSHGFQSSTVVSGTDVRGVLFDGSTGTASASQTTEYESLLDSGELNLRTREWSRVAAIAGLRVVQVEDLIRYTNDSDTSAYSSADNELYGVQFGAEGILFRSGRISIEGTVKAGVFYNNLDVVMDTSNVDFTERFHKTAFVGEANLFMRYHFTPFFSLRAGYQGIWLDGVALIPDQFDDFTVVGNSADGRPDLTTIEYHGGLIGLEATW